MAIVTVLVGLGLQLNPNEAQLKNFPGTGTAIAGRAAARRRRHLARRDEAVRDLVEHGGDAQAVARREARTCPGIVGATVPPARTGTAAQDTLVEAFPAIDGAAPGIQGVDQPRQRRRSAGTDATLGGVARRRSRLRARRLRQLPVRARVRPDPDAHPADAGVPLDRAGGQGRDPQPPLARRGVRDRRLHLPEGPRLVALEHHRDAGDHRLDPVDDLRLPVRPLDGLRGLHALADARGVRRDRLDRPRRSSSAWRAPGSSSRAPR